MKIEIITTDETDAGIRSRRHGAVLLLASMPVDEARLAIQQWMAWREAEDEADEQAAATLADEVVQAQEPQPEPQPKPTPQPQPEPTPQPQPEPEPRPKPKPNGLPDAAKPTYQKFTYGDRSFSVHKRGPKAALAQAFADILGETDPARLLGQLSLQLSGLVGIFKEIGRTDLAEQIAPALEKRKAELAGASPPAEAPVKTSDVLVDYKGQKLRPDIARAMCLNHIRACTSIEALDQLSREADRLADQLDELGPVAARFSGEIRAALTKQTNELAQAEAPTASEPAQRQEAPAQPANGAGGDGAQEPELLRHLLRRAQHEFGIRWVNDLLKKHGASSGRLIDLADAKEPAVRAVALEALAQAG